ncbi:cytochrome o ubiquinol oxidase subunit IV [Paenibacillus protaetiae]|uniref:Cytochrome o ubiquinol oxidase subunit IV n=1 Tax=Paenibacillus protaetiae TaxID=2509456 RepID=A0A4P6F2Q1_9BACL|nr:cytochrome o ubiquinol oxidase subunit IV [Paenibacillus protaetiae]QAY67367.1 cytochrome o ubiquinol oxidase subunit IV [Paenibacillus protaetiae]
MSNHNAHSNHGHDAHDEGHGSLKSYVFGFVLSIVLTIIPLVVVMNDLMSHDATFVLILIMAVLQFVVQLFFFMHLREEKKPAWNVMALILGLIIVITIVVGSVWIMHNNYMG